MTLYVFTIGTGKNGTHTMHEAVKASSKRGVSLHQPKPTLELAECMLYQGHVTRWELSNVWEYNQLIRTLRDYRQPLVHVAANRLTLLSALLFKDLSDAKAQWRNVRFVLPVRGEADLDRFIASNMLHGTYGKHQAFIRPYTPHLRKRFEALPQPAKIAWLWRQKNRIAKELIAPYPHRVIETERLGGPDTDRLFELFDGYVDGAAFRAAASRRHGGSAEDKRKLMQHAIDQSRPRIEDVLRGDLDEPMPRWL